MEDVGGVHEEESSQDLVDEILNMFIAELLPRVDDAVQVRFHQFGDDVDVSVTSTRLGFEDVH